MLLLIEAGLRKSEASALQVRRLRLDPSEVTVVGGKGGKDRVVPMTARLQQRVQELLLFEQLKPEDHLWYTRPGGGHPQRSTPISKGSFAVWWSRCLTEAGVRYRNPHTARHTFATRWLRRGGRMETLSLVMGHASIATTHGIYAHLDTSDILIDVARIDALS
jgi:integrase/recombinase XerD